MHELTFFRQARYDGGVRMGIELDGEVALLIDFHEGPPEEQDNPLGSALLWYVDIRCRGEALPTEPESVRQWFLTHSSVFRAGLTEFAEQIMAGTDDDFPLRWTSFPGHPADVEIELVCSSIRRIRGREFADVILDLADRFEDYLRTLSGQVHTVSSGDS
jgi:hypothetical protein